MFKSREIKLSLTFIKINKTFFSNHLSLIWNPKFNSNRTRKQTINIYSKKSTIENIKIISKIKEDLKIMETAKIIKISNSKILIKDINIINNTINRIQINLNDFHLMSE